MEKIYCYLTKYCFLTAFLSTSIIWVFFGYDNFYERFNKIDKLDYSIQNTIYNVCAKDEDFTDKTKEFEKAFKGLKDISVTITNEKYGKIYESNSYKSIWYEKDSLVAGTIRTSKNKEDFGRYEYKIKYQYKCILPIALLRVWSFSIIPNYNYFFYVGKTSINSFLKLYMLQSIYFWIMFFIFYNFLQFYKKELKL